MISFVVPRETVVKDDQSFGCADMMFYPIIRWGQRLGFGPSLVDGATEALLLASRAATTLHSSTLPETCAWPRVPCLKKCDEARGRH